MRFLFFLLVSSFTSAPALGQQTGQPIPQLYEIPTPKSITGDGSLIIQRIELQDSIIVREIKKLIAEETVTTELVRRGLGYLDLYISEYDNSDYRFLRRYDFFISFHIPRRSWSNNAYPSFYTYLAGRLILVNISGLKNTVKLAYSAKAKKQLRKRIDQFLEKPQRMVFRDMDGKVAFIDKHGRTEPAGRFDSGKVVYIKRDGSVIVRMANDFSPVK